MPRIGNQRAANNNNYAKNVNVSQDEGGRGVDLDVSGYSVTANMQRIDKPKLGFVTDDDVTMGDHETQSHGSYNQRRRNNN